MKCKWQAVDQPVVPAVADDLSAGHVLPDPDAVAAEVVVDHGHVLAVDLAEVEVEAVAVDVGPVPRDHRARAGRPVRGAAGSAEVGAVVQAPVAVDRVSPVAVRRGDHPGDRSLQERAAVPLETAASAASAGSGGSGGSGALLACPFEDLRTDAVLLLLQCAQLCLVGAPGARSLGLRRAVPDHELRDLGLGLRCRTLEALAADEVGAGLLALDGDGLLGLLDLGLLRDHLGAGFLEVLEQLGLLVHQRVDRVHLAGDLGGVSRVQHHRQAHQLRVTIGIVARCELADRLPLDAHSLLRGLESDSGQRQLVLGGLESSLHQLVEPHGLGDLLLRSGQSDLCTVEGGTGAAEPAGCGRQRLAGLVQIPLGTAHLVAHVALLVPEVLGHGVGSHRGDPGCEQDRARKQGTEPVRPVRGGWRLRSGEGAHVAVQ